MLELAIKGVNPTVVADQVGRLTFTSTIVNAIDHLLKTKVDYGTYNISNDGEPNSWANITRKIYELASLKNTVTDISTAEYYKGKEYIAPRPLLSELNLKKIKATGLKINNWQADLLDYISANT